METTRKKIIFSMKKINVKVKPNSRKQKIKKISDNEYLVLVKSKAEKNKANIELLKLLKKYLQKNIKIIKGKKSKNKVVEIK